MNERTRADLSFKLKDTAGRVDTPSSLTYRIDCLTTGRPVRAATPVVPPVGEGTLMLTAEDTAIINPDNAQEVKRVTVIATYGMAEDRLSAEFDVKVDRVRFAV